MTPAANAASAGRHAPPSPPRRPASSLHVPPDDVRVAVRVAGTASVRLEQQASDGSWATRESVADGVSPSPEVTTSLDSPGTRAGPARTVDDRGELLSRVGDREISSGAEHAPVYLTRRGRRVAAVIDADDLERILELAEDMVDIRAAESARAEMRVTGETRTTRVLIPVVRIGHRREV